MSKATTSIFLLVVALLVVACVADVLVTAGALVGTVTLDVVEDMTVEGLCFVVVIVVVAATVDVVSLVRFGMAVGKVKMFLVKWCDKIFLYFVH